MYEVTKIAETKYILWFECKLEQEKRQEIEKELEKLGLSKTCGIVSGVNTPIVIELQGELK